MNLRSTPAVGRAISVLSRLPPAPSGPTLTWSAAVCAIGLGWVGALWEVRPDRVLVEHVRFEGASRATPASLRHLARVPNGTTMWQVDGAAIARGVERHPWVRHAEVAVRWPDTVVVTVEEHVPVALLHLDDALVWVDGQGAPFLEASGDPAGPGLDFPHLTGFGELRQWHPELLTIAVRDALWIVAALDDRGLLERDRLSEIAFSRSAGFLVVSDAARLRFAPSRSGWTLADQVDRLAVLLGRGVSLSEPIEIDLAPESVALVRPLLPAFEPLPPVVPPPLPSG